VENAGALGDYLRARRERIRPKDVGLAPGGRRRVTGLRREELALLAGISSDYYLRLEQGRDKHPSPRVVDALAQALRLDTSATAYLRRLASPTSGRPPSAVTEPLAAEAAALIDQFPMPAIVSSRYQDVLGANPMARALSPAFTPGQNFLRWRLLDPRARDLHADWEEATAILVAGLRELAASHPRDPRLRALVDELSSSSERFRELWARADVGYHTGIGHLRHPQVGDLYLHHYKLDIAHSGGLHILIYAAEPGSRSARALDELRSLSLADQRPID
jgi:transcriptional regulator with XRE-family HTH domain